MSDDDYSDYDLGVDEYEDDSDDDYEDYQPSLEVAGHSLRGNVGNRSERRSLPTQKNRAPKLSLPNKVDDLTTHLTKLKNKSKGTDIPEALSLRILKFAFELKLVRRTWGDILDKLINCEAESHLYLYIY